MPKISGSDPSLNRVVRKNTRLPQKPTSQAQQNVSFADLLSRQVAQPMAVKFSAHAVKRLEESQIALDGGQVERLTDAVDMAASKGARESLILMDNLAFVVSVRNRTVITAVDGQRMKQNVFTNIDSAVIT